MKKYSVIYSVSFRFYSVIYMLNSGQLNVSIRIYWIKRFAGFS